MSVYAVVHSLLKMWNTKLGRILYELKIVNTIATKKTTHFPNI